jgi:hypothetical protein
MLEHMHKGAAAAALVVFALLLLARDGAPVKYTKTLTALAGAALATTVSLAAGSTLNQAIEHAIAGGGLFGFAAFAASAAKASPTEAAPPTPKVPPLPLLALLLVLAACTPGEVRKAEHAAVMAEPACRAGLRLADAAELAPLCAELPELVDAVAELVHEGQPATGAAVHRRCAARRTGGHRDAGAP